MKPLAEPEFGTVPQLQLLELFQSFQTLPVQVWAWITDGKFRMTPVKSMTGRMCTILHEGSRVIDERPSHTTSSKVRIIMADGVSKSRGRVQGFRFMDRGGSTAGFISVRSRPVAAEKEVFIRACAFPR
jgi:hypothetical protein